MRANDSVKRLLIAAASIPLSSLTTAADYAAGFSIGGGVSHNDNIRLVQEDEIAATKYVLSPTLLLSAATETSEIKFDSTFDFNRYDRDEFDSDDQRASLRLSRQFEKSSLALNAAYINNTTLTSELITSGRIGVNAERATQYQLAPQWTYNVNETNMVQVQANYSSQDYESDTYTGYENTGAQIDWFHNLTERMSWITSVTYSDYQSDDVPVFSGLQSYSVRTKSKGANLGLSYEWSEQTSIEARLGRAKIKTQYPIDDPRNLCSDPLAVQLGALCTPLPDSDAYSSTANVTWRWKNERHQISLNGTKQTQPTSNGYAVDSIQIGSNWSYSLTERDQLSAALTLVRNRAIDNKNSLRNASNADRDYGTATLAYQRQLSEEWSVRASYQYSSQKYTEVDYEADSNVWALSVNYRPQQWHWAR